MIWNLFLLCCLLLVGNASARGPNCLVEYDSSTYVMNFTFDAKKLGNFDSLDSILVCPKCDCAIPEILVNAYNVKIGQLEKRIEVLETGGVRIGKWHYWFSTDKMSWEDGQKKCESIEMRLASAGVRDRVTRGKIEEAIVARGREFFWIGLDDRVSEGIWVWSDYVASIRSETNWRPGEPNDHGKEDCAVMEIGIVDVSCRERYRVICEREI